MGVNQVISGKSATSLCTTPHVYYNVSKIVLKQFKVNF